MDSNAKLAEIFRGLRESLMPPPALRRQLEQFAAAQTHFARMAEEHRTALEGLEQVAAATANFTRQADDLARAFEGFSAPLRSGAVAEAAKQTAKAIEEFNHLAYLYSREKTSLDLPEFEPPTLDSAEWDRWDFLFGTRPPFGFVDSRIEKVKRLQALVWARLRAFLAIVLGTLRRRVSAVNTNLYLLSAGNRPGHQHEPVHHFRAYFRALGPRAPSASTAVKSPLRQLIFAGVRS